MMPNHVRPLNPIFKAGLMIKGAFSLEPVGGSSTDIR
jgi:hypothetical protein